MYGLVLHPFMVDNKIKWEVENPNDVSFASTVVEGHLEEMLHDFLKLAGVTNGYNPTSGIDWSELSRNYCRLNKDDVYVGRIRQHNTLKNSIALWLATDNIRKGAALNAIQVAEEMARRGWLTPKG